MTILPLLVLIRLIACRKRLLTGLLGDVAAAVQLSILSPLILLTPIFIIDLFMYRESQSRFRHKQYRHVKDLPFFWGSISRGRRIGFVTALLAALTLCIATLLYTPLFSPWALLGLLGIFLPEKHPFLNLLLLEQRWLISRLKKNPSRSHTFTFPNEEYTSHKSLSPLDRRTHRFTGERLFKLEKRPKHIVMVFLESFRTRSIGHLTPNFDRLSREGVYFPNCIAAGAYTDKAIIAALFGTYPKFSEAQLNERQYHTFYGLPQILKGEGFHLQHNTGGSIMFDSQGAIFTDFGFHSVEGMDTIRKLYPETFYTQWGVDDRNLARHARARFLKSCAERSTFQTVLTTSCHYPWKHPDPSIDATLNDPLARYESIIGVTDEALGILTEGVDDTLFILAGDHGRSIYEHTDHPFSQDLLYQEIIHVPLLFYGKGLFKPQVIDTHCSQIDIQSTLLDLLDISADHHAMGTSLCRKTGTRDILSTNCSGKYLSSLISYPHKIIDQKHYNLEEDPDEKRPLSRNLEMEERLNTLTGTLAALYRDNCITQILAPAATFSEVTKHLKKSPRLNLCADTPIQRSELETLIDSAPHITQFSLKDSFIMHDDHLISLIDRCSNLDHLDLTRCPLITKRGLKHLFTRALRLKSLTLRSNTDLDDTLLSSLDLNLDSLNLLDSPYFSDDGFYHLTACGENLRSLILTVPDVSDKAFESLATNCPNLLTLTLYQPKKITPRAIEKILTLPQLYQLNVIGPHNSLEYTDTTHRTNIIHY